MTQSHPPTHPAAPGSNGRLAWVFIGVLATVLLALVVVIGLLAWRLVAEPDASPTRPAASTAAEEQGNRMADEAAAESADAAPAPASTAPVPDSDWQTVTSAKDDMLFDVPPDWTSSPETLAGYESPAGEILALVHTVATSGDDWCGRGSSLTLTGFVTPGSKSDKGSIAQTAWHWAVSAGLSEDGKAPTATVGKAKSVEVDRGKITATMVTATTEPIDPKCEVPSLEVTVVSVPKPSGGEALFVMVAQRGVDGAAGDATLEKVVASLRLA